LNDGGANELGAKPNDAQPTGRVELVRRFPFMLQKIRARWRPRKTVVKRIDNEEAVRQENPTALELAPRTLFGIWLRLLTGRQSSRQKQYCANGSNQ